ncbi:MAG: DUF2520 domain-containing protein [Rikenellaceae bacterium]|nr:DUF2520 domain-containing protein [Rikenellaceae bacterium]
MTDTVIVGSGNLAWALTEALTKAGTPPLQVFSRNTAEEIEVAKLAGCRFVSDPAALAPAGLYILAVSDRAIPNLTATLPFGDAVVAHTAGSWPLDAISDKVKHKAVFYPLQTFTKGRSVDFSAVPLFIEGSDETALSAMRDLALALGGEPRELDSAKRALLHTAAVFASNFTNYMYTVGEELAAEAGADFSVLKPLIAETAAKAVDARSARDTQTGPAIRNDFQTKSTHCELLREKPDLKNIYINLSKSIWETSRKI